ADVRRRVLHGLCSADTHHTSNSFVLDPAGGLYFQEGTFHHTQVETPYGPPVRSANAGVFRFEPNTSKFEVYVAYGFANPHGHVFDRWGQDFIHDGTGAVPYHGTLFSGHLDFPAKHSAPPTLYNQRTRPCPATELVSGNHFPPEMQGNLLVGNVIGFQGILQYRLRDRGASFIGEEVEPILFSTDPSFRPVDLEIAPDGSLYFTDWQNPIIGHMQHNLRDPNRDRKHGRVYRVTYRDRAVDVPPQIAGAPVSELVTLLGHPGDRIRYRAKIELRARPSAEVIAAADKWLSALDPSDAEYEHHRLEVLWLHQYHNIPSRSLLEAVLASPDFRARAAAVRVASHWRDQFDDTLSILKRAATDEHPRVRLEAIRAASFLPIAEAVEVPLITTELASDEYIEYTRNETMRALEPYWRSALERGEPIAVTSEVGMRWLLQRVRVDELVTMPRSGAVYQELLTRDDVAENYRREAIEAMANANDLPPLLVLLEALKRLDAQAALRSSAFDLGRLLANWNRAELQANRDKLSEFAANAASPATRQFGFVALMMADGNTQATWELACKSVSSLKDVIASVAMIPDFVLQEELAARIEPLFEDLPGQLKQQLGDRQDAKGTYGRYVRIELPGRRRTLTLAEVEVMSDGRNIARGGTATQSATSHGGVAERAIDGRTSGSYSSGTQTHTPENSRDPWWEVDLGDEYPLDAIRVFNRTEGGLGRRL
ncbi:MAG: HEAT repeat domain-containing protein, partial [Planctomycetales bacterium]|nr:HEAT repeat domain-containing protein [Planctomycetales bacterium]